MAITAILSSAEYPRPDEAVKLAGVRPEEIRDIVMSHSHWDHLGGIDLFPKANVWIQKEGFRYYTGDAWQRGGVHRGIDPQDVKELVRVNTEGRRPLVDGDNVEILPGVRAHAGGRHTFPSESLRIEGDPPFVLAPTIAIFNGNLAEHKASSDADHAANLKNQERMIQLAGGNPERVIPGHDALQFQKYPTTGRIAKIKWLVEPRHGVSPNDGRKPLRRCPQVNPMARAAWPPRPPPKT